MHKVITPAKLEIKLHSRSAIVSFNPGGLHDPFYIDKKDLPTRGTIKTCSPKSRNRARLILEDNRGVFKVKACLTYPSEYPSTGKEVKRHLDILLKRIRRKYGEIKYFWVLEFQDRGAPHLHLLIDTFIHKDWLSKSWYEIVDSGDPAHLSAGTYIAAIKDPDHDIGYLTTYLGKEYQKKVPEEFGEQGRFWSSNLYSKPETVIRIRGEKKDIEEIYKDLEAIYGEKLKSWSLKSGKEYKFKDREYPGFTGWDTRKDIERALTYYALEVKSYEEQISKKERQRISLDNHHAFSRLIINYEYHGNGKSRGHNIM